jgi:mannose/fructose-specific phosphotransferase system component IIA
LEVLKLAKIILASHGDLSKGIKHSLGMIIGSAADAVETYSLYPGESAADCASRIGDEAGRGGEQFIVVTDIVGGSVCNEFIALLKYPNVTVLSGMNLALALELALNAGERLSAEEIDEMLGSARGGIRRFSADDLPPRAPSEDF